MIEDDERLAKMVGDYLRQSGFGFAHAADGVHGLSAVQLTPPDLVILDLMLPDMDGLATAENIRSLGLAHAPLVIMVTAFASVDSAIDAIKAGAWDYITKPVDSDELQAKIQALN